jgi:hypothetical protein
MTAHDMASQTAKISIDYEGEVILSRFKVQSTKDRKLFLLLEAQQLVAYGMQLVAYGAQDVYLNPVG